MYGLIIKKKWLDLILSGKKTLEIRGSKTTHLNEPIYLLESGSGLVRGKCIIKGQFPISCSDWSSEFHKHLVDIPFVCLKDRYKTPYAWELDNVEVLEEKHYNHPKGAVIWVRDVENKLNR